MNPAVMDDFTVDNTLLTLNNFCYSELYRTDISMIWD